MEKKEKRRARNFTPEYKYNRCNGKANTTMVGASLEEPERISKNSDGTKPVWKKPTWKTQNKMGNLIKKDEELLGGGSNRKGKAIDKEGSSIGRKMGWS